MITRLGELVVVAPFNFKPVLVNGVNVVAKLDILSVMHLNVLDSLSALPVKLV